ncbi:hypothetical protein F1880_009433, partial [Penicillium rolfsii]
YLAYIRPFEECLHVSLYQQLPKAHALLFYYYRTNRPFLSKVLSSTLRRAADTAHQYQGLASYRAGAPKEETGPSSLRPAEPIVLLIARPLVEFRYPLRPGATALTLRVSIGHGPTYSPDKPSNLDADSGLAIRQLAYSPLVPSQSYPGLGLLTSASFRSVEQRDAFYLIMKRTPYFFLILPTAAGKTTLFLLGASLFAYQVTILIIPLISLKLDLYEKAKALGLEPTSRVILVQIEHIVHPKFYEMAEHFISQKRLCRLLRMLQLLERLCLTYRATTVLKHMAYRVEPLPVGLRLVDYAGYLMQFIKRFEIAYQPFRQRDRARVIIFCRSKALVDSLFEALQPYAARFHASLIDDDKLGQLDRFRGDTLLLLATSGIGAGYDFP